MSTIFTLGHSSHEWTRFVSLLGTVEITMLVDVRSAPASRLPHFNRAALRAGLNAAGIEYQFMGRELGGRPRCGGTADYEQMAKSPDFHAGLDRLEEFGARQRVVVVCAEAEPLQCHRFLLIARRLAERGAEVEHILRDGRIEPHEQTEDRLLKATHQSERDLFASRADRLARAYRDQNLRLWRLRRR